MATQIEETRDADIAMRKRARRFVLWNAAVFACSLPFDAYTTAWEGESSTGAFGLLLIGWLGVPMGYFEWFANPLLLIAWICLWIRKPRHAIPLAVAACAIAVAFAFRDKILVNEAGYIGRIVSLDAGYWLWVASAAGTLGTAIALTFGKGQRPAH